MSVSSYFLIEFGIRNKILNGELRPGEKLPSERDLSNRFGVSTITIRTALSHLERDGLILRKPGKGTFVREGIPLNKPILVTFEGNIHPLLLEPGKYSVKVLGIDEMKISETRMAQEIERFFSLSSSDTISMVRRTRFMDKNPIQYVENFISPDIAKHLTAEELTEKTLQKTLRDKIGFRIGKSEVNIESIPAEPDVAELLECDVFIPLLLLQAYVWFPSGEPFEIVNFFGNPAYFKYRIKSDN